MMYPFSLAKHPYIVDRLKETFAYTVTTFILERNDVRNLSEAKTAIEELENGEKRYNGKVVMLTGETLSFVKDFASRTNCNNPANKETLKKFEGALEEFTYDLDSLTHYCPSATAGDYSPSCPWNAPGMSIHDFI